MTVTVQEAIYRAKVEGQQSVDGLARSVDGLAVSEEKLTRSMRASEQGFERLVAKVDPAARAHQQYQRTLEQVARYEAAGIGSMQQRSQVLQIAQHRYEQQIRVLNGAAVANDNFAKRTGLASHQVTNLSYQINDIATMLTMGASPFAILASQGGQVYQILAGSERGVIGAIKGMGAAIVGFLGPLGLAAAGLTAAGGAAYYFWTSSQEPAKTTEELLEEQVRLIGLIEKGYKDSASAVDKFAASVSAVVRLQEEQNRLEIQRRLTQGTQDVVGKITSITPSTMAGFIDEPLSGQSQVIERYRAFTKQIEDLQAGLSRGAPDVKRFREEVAAMAVTAPGMRSLANELLNMTDALGKLDPSKLQQTREELERIAQVEAAKGFQSAYQSLLSAAPETNKDELRQQKLLDLARKRGEAIDNINKSEALYADRTKHLADIDVAYRRAVAEAMKEDLSAYGKLIQRTDDRIEQLKLEAQTAGRTSSEVVKLRLQHEAERAALEAGIPVNQKDLDILKERLAVATREAQVAGVRRDIAFDRGTIGLSEQDVRIAQQLRQIYPSVKDAMESKEAADLRGIDNMREMKTLSADFAQTLVGGLMQGKDAMESLTQAAQQLISKLASQSLKRFMDTGSLFPQNGPGLMSAQGGVGMVSAGLAGYQSGSPLTGALGGAMAGASFGPAGMVAGGLIGGVSGWFGQSAQQKQAEREAEAARQAEIAARNRSKKQLTEQYTLRGQLAGIDSSTKEGSLRAFDLRAQSELRQASRTPGIGREELAVAERALAKERLQIVKDFAKQAKEAERERRQSYDDRIFAAGLDMAKLEDALSAFDRNAMRQRQEETKAGGEAMVALDRALAAERLNLIEQFNEQAIQLEEQRIAALTQTAKGVLDYVNQLQTGASSPLSPAARFAAAQYTYNETRSMAAGGDAESYERFTQVAESYRQAAQAMYGSAAGYQNVFNQLVSDALNLTPPSAAADPVVAKLQEVVSVIGLANNAIQLGANNTFNALQANTVATNAQGAANKAAVDATRASFIAGVDQQLNSLGLNKAATDAARAAIIAGVDQQLASLLANTNATNTQGVLGRNAVDATRASIVAGIDQQLNSLGLNKAAVDAARAAIISGVDQQLASLLANTDATNMQGVLGRNAVNAAKAAIDQAKLAVDQTKGAVTTAGGSTTNAVNAAKVAVDQTKGTISATSAASDLIANQQKALQTTQNALTQSVIAIQNGQTGILDGIRTLGQIQRQIGNALGNSIESAANISYFWFPKLHAQLKAINKSGSQEIAGPGFWDWAGFESGGVVGNGIYGRDSVMARYAGGGAIGLAGGEGVLTAGATSAIGGGAAIDYINRTGMLPANDNGGVIAAINSMNSNVSAMLARIASLEEKNASLTAQLIAQNSDWQESEDRKSRRVAGKAGHAA